MAASEHQLRQQLSAMEAAMWDAGSAGPHRGVTGGACTVLSFLQAAVTALVRAVGVAGLLLAAAVAAAGPERAAAAARSVQQLSLAVQAARTARTAATLARQ
jgi:hypothetical protein